MAKLRADAVKASPPRSHETYAETRARLRSAQKPAVGVPAYLFYVNRPIGGRLAARAYVLGLKPNHLTAVSAALSAAGIAAIALVTPTPLIGVGIALLLLLGYAFDSADGQLARLRGGGGPAGEWLDHVVDIAKTAGIHCATLIALDRAADLPARGWLLVPLLFLVVNVTFFFAMMLRDKLGAKPQPPGDDGMTTSVRSFFLLPIEYGLLSMSYALLSWTDLFLVVYVGLCAGMTLFASQSLVKAFYRLNHL